MGTPVPPLMKLPPNATEEDRLRYFRMFVGVCENASKANLIRYPKIDFEKYKRKGGRNG